MLDVRFIPLKECPGKPTAGRKSAPFKATYVKTLDLLETELRHLRARNIVVQAWFRFDQIRNDGWPYSGQRPGGPGIVLSFDTPSGAMSFPCDTYTAFEDNMRAIALSLEALRAVNRYGVTRRDEQYQGWKRLPPPSDRPFQTKEEAARFIASQTDDPGFCEDGSDVLSLADIRQAAYKLAAGRLHPDRPGGSHEMFVRLQAAMRMLDEKKAAS